MSGIVTTLPTGLLGLLGIKNDGQYPRALAEFHQPVLDMLCWIAGDRARELVSDPTAAFTTGGQKPGSGGLTLVPPGEVRLVWAANATVSTLAADSFTGFCNITRTFGAQRQAIRASELQRTSATDAAAVGSILGVIPGPFLMFPGDQVELSAIRVVTATSLTGFVACVFTRFPL